ncbi:MAG: M15 family metallopeptidase [Oscillibacter sp.]|nr:M15 family metallopeptidase [Oscillibacter sp.]
MSRSCIIREFPLLDREYYAAAPARWDERPAARPRRPAPSRVRRKDRRPLPALLALAGLTLFATGFLLGRAEAAPSLPAAACAGAVGEPSPPAAGGQNFTTLPEEPDDIRVQTLPDGADFDGQGDPEDWRLLLVNGQNPLPEGFSVPELTQLRNGHAIDSRAYPDLQRMMDACRAAGLEPLICSSWRSWEKQEELFERKVRSCLTGAISREEAEEQAAVWVSRPGTSEHQAGLAVDIVDKSYQLLDQGQEETAVQKWLMENCAEYGFILRYPTEKSALTGVGYEPWHYRYVGTEAAGEIMRRGICLEEYLTGLE